MRCPICSSPLNEVRETRPKDTYIYRRRQCFNGHLFTTHERPQPAKTSPVGGLQNVPHR